MLTRWQLPDWMTEEQFEEYFERSHSVNARYMEGFRRYAVNRRVPRPPASLAGPQLAHHISENWWDSVAAIEDCFNSWGGFVDFGDTVALHGAEFFEMIFMRDTPVPLDSPAGIDPASGRLASETMMVKVFGFVPTAAEERWDAWCDRDLGAATRLPGLRRLATASKVPGICQLGTPDYRTVFPPFDPPFSRTLELWFDSVQAVDPALDSEAGRALLQSLSSAEIEIAWQPMRSQDVFFDYEL